MAFSDADLSAIQLAIAKGELIVEFADRKVTYRSIQELLQAEARISQALATTTRSKQFVGVSCKGF